MKKYFVLVFLCSLAVISLNGQPDIYERKKLFELLEQRKQKFDAYSASIEKRSGIFGNKTKKDMQQSNAVLTEIVRTDNNIIGVLNRAVDFKNYEKVNLNYDANENSQQRENLLQAVDTLSKQVEFLTTSNLSLKQQAQWSKILTRALVLLVLIMLLLLLRKKRKTAPI